MMNPLDGEYLHVACKWDRIMDGPGKPTKKSRRWYRVRCKHHIGSKWRGGVVTEVRVRKHRGLWEWVVSVAK